MKWKTTWSYLPINYGIGIGTVRNVTQRTSFWNNLSGEKIRLKFSNQYGTKPLLFEKVVVARRKQNTGIITGFTAVKKDNAEQICIEPGKEFYSDEIEWEIEAGTEIILSVHIKEAEEVQSACSSLAAKSWNTVYSKKEGCYVTEQSFDEINSLEKFPKLKQYPDPNAILIGIREIQILTEQASSQIVMFGDSIVHMSMFADAFAKCLYRENKGKAVVLNRGISGNRILRDPLSVGHIPGNGSIYGDAAVKRFQQECFECGIPEHIIFLEGTNDMIFPEWFGKQEDSVTAEELAQAISQMAEIAHERGSKFWLGTILPYQNPEQPVCPKAEIIRNDLNRWIREQKISEGVLDFDKILSDSDKPFSLREDVHIGDWLHPNEKGGELMAQEVLRQLGCF